MSAMYDNWERLVGAVLKKEQLWQLFHSDSVSPSISSDSSGFSFSHLNSSLDDVPFCFPNYDWSASDQKQKSTPSILVEDHPPINKNVTSNPPRKRNLKIEVPKIRIEDVNGSQECRPSVSPRVVSPNLSPGVNPRAGGVHSKSEMKWSNGAKQQSYPLPLPPGATANSSPVSPVAKPPSTPSRSPERAGDVKSPGTSWKKGKLIGRGPLGNVYLGFNSEKGEMCAMKESRVLSDADMTRGACTFEKEIALLSHMKHPNIVQYFGSKMVGDNLYICLEYVSGGSVHTILQEYGKLEESAIRNYTLQILAGLAYLHSKNIVHGNIKAASILVGPNGGVKLTSFIIEKHIAGKSNQSFLVHSPYWVAPEVIMNSNVHNAASDIWSLGCTVLEMATSKPPLSQYKGVMAMFKVACQNEVPTIPDHLSDVCKDFLRCCLQLSPLHRSTASQLLEHPFIRSSSPLGKQMLTSSSSGHSMVRNALKSEGTNSARSPHLLDSGKVVRLSSMASNSTFQSSDIYTPRNISAPVSPVGSPFLHPALPEQVKRQMSPPPESSPPMAMIGSVKTHHLNQAMLVQEAPPTLTKHSKMSSPSYWDPNILQAVFRFS